MANMSGDYTTGGVPANSSKFAKGTLSGLGIVTLAQSQINYNSAAMPNRNPTNNTKRKADVKIKLTQNSNSKNNNTGRHPNTNSVQNRNQANSGEF